jgi:hypothetical protein
MKIVPFTRYKIEVVEYDLANFPLILRAHAEGICRTDIVPYLIDPKFALHLPFPAVDMHRFGAFIGIEKKTPSKKQ